MTFKMETLLSTIIVPTLLGLVVSAGPAPSDWSTSPEEAVSQVSSSVSAPSAVQTPFQFPLPNGFPNITRPGRAPLEKQGHGTLPNGPLPSKMSDAAATSLGLIAFNEYFEVAYFTSLIYNITNNVTGYDISDTALRETVLGTLTAVQAQEELHALGANIILENAGRDPLQPCEYVFPVNNIDDAISIASKFVDVVIGTLEDILYTLCINGDSFYIPLVSSAIGQEGEQNGFYRNLLNKIPTQLPFLTRVPAAFAFSALNQAFVVPGSCPVSSLSLIPLPVFAALNVETQNILAKTQQLTFSFRTTNTSIDTTQLSLVYINQQNLPVTEPLQNVVIADGEVTFSADFPFDKYLMNGLTVAAVVMGTGNFSTADDVAEASLFGPGLIDID